MKRRTFAPVMPIHVPGAARASDEPLADQEEQSPALPEPAPALAAASGSEKVKLAVGLLAPSPRQSRQFREREAIDEIAESFKEHGQLYPIIVYPAPAGNTAGVSYYILSGVTRWLAAKSLAWSELDAEIKTELADADPLTLVGKSLAYNKATRESNYDLAVLAKGLLAEGLVTQADVGLVLGVHRSMVTRLIALVDSLPEDFSAAIKGYETRLTIRARETMAPYLELDAVANEDIAAEFCSWAQRNAELSDLDSKLRALQRQGSPNRRRRSPRLTRVNLELSGQRVGTLNVLEAGENKTKLQMELVVDSPLAEEMSKAIQRGWKSLLTSDSAEDER